MRRTPKRCRELLRGEYVEVVVIVEGVLMALEQSLTEVRLQSHIIAVEMKLSNGEWPR